MVTETTATETTAEAVHAVEVVTTEISETTDTETTSTEKTPTGRTGETIGIRIEIIAMLVAAETIVSPDGTLVEEVTLARADETTAMDAKSS